MTQIKRIRLRAFARNFFAPIVMIVLKLRRKETLSPFQNYIRDGYITRLYESLDLTSDDLALEFGGFLGESTSNLVKRFDCSVHVFEPVPKFYSYLVKRFSSNPKVKIHNFAIGQMEGNRTFFELGVVDEFTAA